MPVKVSDHLPAIAVLAKENIFIMSESRASVQDIRPLRIGILNLMPTKIETETQLLRVIGNTPLQVDITLLRMASHISKNTPTEHLDAFYKTFDEVSSEKFDGLIITGAPVEQMNFEEVRYWDELTQIMDWADAHVQSTLNICWAAQAGLYYRYGVQKHPLLKKRSGVYKHKVHNPTSKLLRGFDDFFDAPHSRHTEIREEDILAIPELELLATSEEAGVFLVASRDERYAFITGHPEYGSDTLYNEYVRDMALGLEAEVPANYFPNNDFTRPPIVTWRAHANLLFSNWLNYFVYQETPYDTALIGAGRGKAGNGGNHARADAGTVYTQ